MRPAGEVVPSATPALWRPPIRCRTPHERLPTRGRRLVPILARKESMRKILAWLVFALGTGALLTLAANAARTDRLLFLSTQLRPIAEAQKMRNLILKDFSREVVFITEPPQGLQARLKAGSASDATAIDVIGALHGELQPLALLDVLVPLDDLARQASGLGIPDTLLSLGKFGTAH